MGELEFESSYQGVRRVSLAEFEAGLAELKRAVEADGAQLLVVSMPRRPGVDMNAPILRKYSACVVDYCKMSGTALFDGRTDFREYRELEHGDANLFFLDGDDYHPSKRGHARIAQKLFESVVASRGPR